jgi:RimJ/RimL family protein N-acetyltransferase
MTPNVELREVLDDDLPILFDIQDDPVAARMIAFTRRDITDRDLFMTHMKSVRTDDDCVGRTILYHSQVAGTIGSFLYEGQREVGYQIARPLWGKGIASTALTLFLAEFPTRPLHAAVAEDNAASLRLLQNHNFNIIAREQIFSQPRNTPVTAVTLKLD